MRITDKYVFFWNGIYSNWYPAKFTLDDRLWHNTEQYMMYVKAIAFRDNKIAEKIAETPDPKECKAYGRLVKNFDAKIWDLKCHRVVYEACYSKFSQNPSLRDEILKDGNGRNFVEASPYDKIWGIGMYEDDPDIEDPTKWQGSNYLGQVLDKVYDALNRRMIDQQNNIEE